MNFMDRIFVGGILIYLLRDSGYPQWLSIILLGSWLLLGTIVGNVQYTTIRDMIKKG